MPEGLIQFQHRQTANLIVFAYAMGKAIGRGFFMLLLATVTNRTK